MKMGGFRLGILVVVIFLICANISHAEIDIDISGSTLEVMTPKTIRVRNVVAMGFPGKYWADLQWDPSTFSFIPVAVGEDSISQTSAEGIWTGIYTTSSSLQFSALALITSNGQTGIDFGNGVFFIGTSTFASNELVITGRECISPSGLVTIGATITPQQKLAGSVLNGAYAVKTGDSLDFVYELTYQKSSSLNKLVAAWSGQNVFSGQGVTMTWNINISSDGTFSGSANNLTLSGNITPIDSNKNEYQVNMTVNSPNANYAINGNYSGIATLLDENGVDSTLLMFLEGDQQSKVLGKLVLQRN